MKKIKVLICTVMTTLFLQMTCGANSVKALETQIERSGGNNRYETAYELAVTNWQQSDNVILASGEGYADALSASVLAKKLNAPILLTTGKSLDSNAKKAIEQLKAKNVYIIGGQGVISSQVRDELKQKYNVVELGGKNRFTTNLNIAEKLVELGVDPSEIIAVNGIDGFSDSLSVAPVAAANEKILLIVSKDNADTALEFVNKHKSKVNIVGTKFVVSDGVYNKLNASLRINGGANRFETNLNVLNAFKPKNNNYLCVAYSSSKGYADALVASALAAKYDAPLVLVSEEDSGDTTKALGYIGNNAGDKTKIKVIGGQGVIPESVIKNIEKKMSKDTQKDENAKEQDIKNAVEVNSRQEYYNVLKTALENFQEKTFIKINNFNKTDYNLQILNRIVTDHPEIDYGFKGASAMAKTYEDGKVLVDLTIKYRLSKSSMIQEKQAVQAKIQQIISEIIKPDMTQVEKELAIHDYIVEKGEYNHKTADNHIVLAEDHNAYGILVKGIGVCESYAKAMYELCKAAGVECRYVTGRGDGELHAWNMVKLDDGKWYNVDATWDDPTYENEDQQIVKVQHDYFNLPDSIMNKDHVRDKTTDYPVADGTKYTFNNLDVKEFDVKGNLIENVKTIEELDSKIKQAIQNKSSRLTVKMYNLNVNSTMLLKEVKKVLADGNTNTNNIKAYGVRYIGESLKYVQYAFQYKN